MTPRQESPPFMAFWKVANDILKSHNLPEMAYGEARDWFRQSGLADPPARLNYKSAGATRNR